MDDGGGPGFDAAMVAVDRGILADCGVDETLVTIAPSIANMSRSLGMAMISLDFSATLSWPSTRRWRAAKAETIWMAAFLPFSWYDRRTVLPSIAITPAGAPVSDATQATKHCWNFSASSVAKMSPS